MAINKNFSNYRKKSLSTRFLKLTDHKSKRGGAKSKRRLARTWK